MVTNYSISEEGPRDLRILAEGHDAKDVFVNAAEALFSIICDSEFINPEIEKELEVEADSLSDLFINWLQSLLSEIDIEDMYFSKFEIVEMGDTYLRAICSGEPVSLEKKGVLVKAATYKDFEFKKIEEGFSCSVNLSM